MRSIILKLLENRNVWDGLFVLAIIVFFLLMVVLVSGCAKLKERG